MKVRSVLSSLSPLSGEFQAVGDLPKIRSWLGTLLSALLIFALLSAIPVTAAEIAKVIDPSRARTAKVTVHLFSGVPDPSWRLSRKQIAELADRISALQPLSADQPWEEPSHLGYRGFSITVKQRRTAERRFFVYDNVMDLEEGIGRRKDSGHSLEKWLLKTAGRTATRHVRSTVLNKLEALNKPEIQSLSGTVRVTLHIFSGVPDPGWELTPEQASVLSEKIQALKVDETNGRWEMPSRLGYRGFTVELKPETGPRSQLYLFNNVLQIDTPLERRTDSHHAMEFWMLRTAGSALEPEARELAEKGLSELESKGPGRRHTR